MGVEGAGETGRGGGAEGGQMKLVFERNGKLIETEDRSGLSAEGRDILDEMEQDETAGHIEHNYYLVTDETETE